MGENQEMLEPETLLKKSDQNLVWLDCEMTGLDPEKERIIEIAVIVTGPQLTPRIEAPVFAIHQSDELLDQMDNWNKGTHGRSGLIDKVKASSVSEQDAETQVLAFLAKYVPKGTSPLCGNTWVSASCSVMLLALTLSIRPLRPCVPLFQLSI